MVLKKRNNFFSFLLSLLFIPSFVWAQEDQVTFSKCVDGDTAKFLLKGEEITVRFLAVDTPETKHPTKGKEPFGQEASDYTCKRITNGKKILLEYDENSEKKDKYDRVLAWVWVDDSLLQDELISKGLAEVAYLYDDYKYTSLLKDHEVIAKTDKKGKWGNIQNSGISESYSWILIIGSIILFIILFMISPKFRKKETTKLKRKIKNKTKHYIKKLHKE